MNRHLIADSELAQSAEVADKTVKRLKAGVSETRVRTRRSILEGLNKLLRARGEKPVGSEVFENA